MKRKYVTEVILLASVLVLLSNPQILLGIRHSPINFFKAHGLAESIQATPPEITSARLKGKKLTVTGAHFLKGSVILINGVEQKTANVKGSIDISLVAKKAGKNLVSDEIVHLQVQNPDGLLSSELAFHTGCAR
jgi:hypothetical protein